MLTHTKTTKTVFSQWIGSTLQCNVAPSLSSRYHPSFVPGSSHLEDPSAPKLTTHLSRNSLPLSAHFSFSLVQFIFTKASNFNNSCCVGSVEKGIPQHCNSQHTSSVWGSLELAALHRSPEAVASVPGRNNPVTDASFKNWHQVHRYTLKH